MTRHKARKAAARTAAATAGVSYTAALRTLTQATTAATPAPAMDDGAWGRAVEDALGRLLTVPTSKTTVPVDAEAVGLAAYWLAEQLDPGPIEPVLDSLTAAAEEALDAAYARASLSDQMFGAVTARLHVPVGQAQTLLNLMALATHRSLPWQASPGERIGVIPAGADRIGPLGAYLAATDSIISGLMSWPSAPRRIVDRDRLALALRTEALAAGAPSGDGPCELGAPGDAYWRDERDALASLARAGVDPGAFADLLRQGWWIVAAGDLLAVLRPGPDLREATLAAATDTLSAGEGDVPSGSDAPTLAHRALVAATVGATDLTVAPRIAAQPHLPRPLYAAFPMPGRMADRQRAAEVLRQRVVRLLD